MKKSVGCRSITELTFALLLSLSAGSVSAVPHAKATAHNKISRVSSSAPGTRLIVTGVIDPATSSVKAISSNNRFTWVRVQPTTLVVQAGRRLRPESIGEGDKLLCQGTWVNDAWGPVFQAKRVEIIGRISEAGLQEKVAAACQSVAGSGSGGAISTSYGQTASGADERHSQNHQNDPAALQDRLDDLDQAKQALWDQIEQSNGCLRAEARKNRTATGDDRDLAKDFEQARQNFDAAVDRLASISPRNYYLSQSCASYRKFSAHIHDGYLQIAGGLDDDHLRFWLIDYNEGLRLSRKAFAESKAHR